MRLSRTFHIGVILSIVIFFTAKFVMERASLRALQLGENKMDVEVGNKHWIYATIVTSVFVVFYALISKQFSRIEDEHEAYEDNEN